MNKLSIGRMKAQFAVSAPEFDPNDQLEIIAKTFLEQADAEKRRDKPNMRLVYDLLDKAARVLRDMVPYKRALLTAMKVSGAVGRAAVRSVCAQRQRVGIPSQDSPQGDACRAKLSIGRAIGTVNGPAGVEL